MSAHRLLATMIRWALLVGLAAHPAAAQVSIFPVQNLSFGNLRAGSAEAISITDAGRRAELQLLGSGIALITIKLPSAMVNAKGQELPLKFSSGDAEIEMKGSRSVSSWDPNKAQLVWIKSNEGGATIRLGGVALPTASQPPGQYRATITVQIVSAGT